MTRLSPRTALSWLFNPQAGEPARLLPRWLFLRALAVIYFSAFFSLVFQIRGLIGPNGILPAGFYLQAVAQSLGHWRFWYAPTLLWWSSGPAMLTALCWAGMVASVLLLLNLWPRGMLMVCFVCFLSFVAAAQDFSGYQSDGMLLEAGFIALFFAPPGLRPGLGQAHPASRASLFLLQWEWFRIYFESGIVKLLSGDLQWRNFTAMDEYYQNGPLPTWIGWYVQHLPHRFHAATVYATLALELGLVWMLILPRRWRIVCFLIVTPWEIAVILTANYTFLNYLVLSLGILLLDDRFIKRILPAKWCALFPSESNSTVPNNAPGAEQPGWRQRLRRGSRIAEVAASSTMLFWIFYATTAEMLTSLPLPTFPILALEPFRIANRYGLFAVMTRGRYEIEFQGSNDGQSWVSYPFRYKPQELNEPPRIYAPYQPRFDWNLWFASLGSWREYPIVPNTEVRLLTNDRDVMDLFAGNPFGNAPPRQIRALLWQYWFTSMEEKRKTGMWWRRRLLGLYAPTLERMPDGQIQVIEWPDLQPQE
ncbi:MAG TPA: lipase maturation factor family protein [Candidatus Sulfotelmatobacter sp.]|nr:lipase maturation factor family protein [Candidatus Sulfotelmatobacter sp.]